MARLTSRLDSSRFSSISFDSQRIRADGKSFCQVRLVLTPEHHDEQVTLRLTAGSFEPGAVVRQVTLTPQNGELAFRIYAPSMPRSGFLLADGLRAPLQFSPASFVHYLAFDLIPTLFFAIIFALVIRSFAIASFYIPSGSMEPTLQIHDRLIADRLSYTLHLRLPRRGDVVIFRYPGNPSQDFIKRVVALPGERVAIRDGEVFVNGQPLDEPYEAEPPDYEMPEITVPEGEYFVLGDNRNHSADSHVWGFVPRRNLVGHALFVYWPPQRAGVIRNPFSEREPPTTQDAAGILLAR
ncbi:MAG: signal peptidase I [Planctomycetales bacterium 4484_113]|nr:MAG: signal peptidase I [Planctomycetales bacterium 4484_113]